MLKGETTIELKDIHTGKVEVYKDTNLFTNTLSTALSICRNSRTFYDDVGYKFLGGLLCFDKALTESATTCYPPADAAVIASGVIDESDITVCAQAGSFNTEESSVTPASRQFTRVWDFPSNKGNGTIRSICLTDSAGGRLLYGNTTGDIIKYSTDHPITDFLSTAYELGKIGGEYVSTQSPSRFIAKNGDDTYCSVTHMKRSYAYNSHIFYLVAVDIANDIAYFIAFPSTTSIILRKVKTSFNHISVITKANMYSGRFNHETDITIDLTSNPLPATRYYINANVDQTNEHLYITYTGTTIDLWDITLSTGAMSHSDISNNTGKTLINTTGTEGRTVYVLDGYMYVISNESVPSIFKINITNASDVHEISTVAYRNLVRLSRVEFMYGTGGRIVTENNKDSNNTYYMHVGIINSYTNRLELSRQCIYYNSNNDTTALIPVIGTGSVPICIGSNDGADYGSSSNSTGVVLLAGALMTVNNLSTPVVKTADKTMKITYTVTETDPS